MDANEALFRIAVAVKLAGRQLQLGPAWLRVCGDAMAGCRDLATAFGTSMPPEAYVQQEMDKVLKQLGAPQAEPAAPVAAPAQTRLPAPAPVAAPIPPSSQQTPAEAPKPTTGVRQRRTLSELDERVIALAEQLLPWLDRLAQFRRGETKVQEFVARKRAQAIDIIDQALYRSATTGPQENMLRAWFQSVTNMFTCGKSTITFADLPQWLAEFDAEVARQAKRAQAG